MSKPTSKQTSKKGKPRYEQRKVYEDIRRDLLDQLDRNATVGEFYKDLIEDYMKLWVTKSKLQDDIDDRGVTVKYDNGGGQCGYKKNDSIEQLLKVNTQMLKILNEIGIKPTQYVGGGDDERL
jgi:hypothetical protein